MNLNTRSLTFLIALAVALVLTAFLALASYFSSQGFKVALVIVFLSCFLLVYFSFEALILREIKNIYSSLDKVKRQDFKKIESKQTTLKKYNIFICERKDKEIYR